METRISDFVTLFNAFWYRDFPVIPGHEKLGKRAVWTTHIAAVVKRCADAMGFFTCFESGSRTDAVIQTAARRAWARVEWEWLQPKHKNVNELLKLGNAAEQGTADVMVFIGYSRLDHHDENVNKIKTEWVSEVPLVVLLVTFTLKGRRHFHDLKTFRVQSGAIRELRSQPALPWMVPDTKWSAMHLPVEENNA